MRPTSLAGMADWTLRPASRRPRTCPVRPRRACYLRSGSGRGLTTRGGRWGGSDQSFPGSRLASLSASAIASSLSRSVVIVPTVAADTLTGAPVVRCASPGSFANGEGADKGARPRSSGAPKSSIPSAWDGYGVGVRFCLGIKGEPSRRQWRSRGLHLSFTTIRFDYSANFRK